MSMGMPHGNTVSWLSQSDHLFPSFAPSQVLFFSPLHISTVSQIYICGHGLQWTRIWEFPGNVFSFTSFPKVMHGLAILLWGKRAEKGVSEAGSVATTMTGGSVPFVTSRADLRVLVHIFRKVGQLWSSGRQWRNQFCRIWGLRNRCNGHNSLWMQKSNMVLLEESCLFRLRPLGASTSQSKALQSVQCGPVRNLDPSGSNSHICACGRTLTSDPRWPAPSVIPSRNLAVHFKDWRVRGKTQSVTDWVWKNVNVAK